MRIGFDVSPLHRPHPPGVVRATRGLVEALERRGVLEVVRIAPRPNADLRRWRHHSIVLQLARNDLLALHSPVSAFPILPAWRTLRRVHTVHELPWRHDAEENAGFGHQFWSSLATHRADAVVAPSEFVARDLRSGTLPPARDIRVVPWGVDACFARADEDASAGDAARARELGDAVRTLGDFVLLPGAARPKKNAEATLAAVATLARERRPRVVITGRSSTEDDARLRAAACALGVEDALVFTGPLDDAALAAHYRAARAVVVLSRSEGFAFPVVEGFACGAPVVVAEGTAQAEIAGDVGLAVLAHEPEDVARALERAGAERAELARRGGERASAFTWDRAAERIEALWKELLD
ncbi:MAG: glycosyltransferase [Planctomycetes bacterium]|nr:glycosyltransferase [Planctomycetota bacterium]